MYVSTSRIIEIIISIPNISSPCGFFLGEAPLPSAAFQHQPRPGGDEEDCRGEVGWIQPTINSSSCFRGQFFRDFIFSSSGHVFDFRFPASSLLCLHSFPLPLLIYVMPLCFPVFVCVCSVIYADLFSLFLFLYFVASILTAATRTTRTTGTTRTSTTKQEQ